MLIVILIPILILILILILSVILILLHSVSLTSLIVSDSHTDTHSTTLTLSQAVTASQKYLMSVTVRVPHCFDNHFMTMIIIMITFPIIFILSLYFRCS